jgi:5-hydroxyisourate hydrolase-like protein (transthyretin family)
MRTEVAASHMRVTPGVPVVLDVEVTNTADVIDGVTATIIGLDPAWVSLVVPVVSLFPTSSSTISMKIDLPTNCLAGEYLVTVHVQSIIEPDRYSDHEFWLSVDPLVAASIDFHPTVIVGGKSAVFQGAVANLGNVPAELSIEAFDETREATCTPIPATLTVPPGETHLFDLHVEGKRPLLASPVTRNVTLTAVGPDLELPAKVVFTQKPRVPRGVLTIAILAAIIAIWATVFLVVIDALRDKTEPTKAPAADFNAGGKDTVNLEAIAATMGGTVTSQSSGAPLPLITVEALRIKADESLESVGSTGTGDDGAFTLESLFPGNYKLRFSADGFAEVWYPAATDSAGAGVVTVGAKEEKAGLNAVMLGNPGSLSGPIVAPESQGAAATITVTVTQKIDKPKEGDPPPTPVPATVDANGVFIARDLPTPATYALRIESPGFAPRTIEETLAAGENKVVNTITLGASPGSLAGNVTDGTGKLLGGVEVTVRSGEFEKTTKTPTSGNVGSFTVDNLETPRTYVITFHLAGYEDHTIAIDLGSGENRAIAGRLIGGSGGISGLVSDSAGIPLGGAAVSVARGTTIATTATLTESGATGQAGTYAVSALPTPGDYTVTVSLEGYISQTVRVRLESASSVTGINVVLPHATGLISGQAFSGGAPAAGVTVELSNGGDPRVTSTASSPAGSYRFVDVAPGSYTLTFRRSGLVTRVILVNVVANVIAEQSIDLAVAAPVNTTPNTAPATTTTVVATATTTTTTTATTTTTTTTVPATTTSG